MARTRAREVSAGVVQVFFVAAGLVALGIFAALVNLPVDQRPIAERRAAAAA